MGKQDRTRGIDAAALQGKIDFKALWEEEQARFAIFRCKIGNDKGRDFRYEENVRNATAQGFHVSPYYFDYPLPHLDPLGLVDTFTKAAEVDGRLVGSRDGDLPAAYDGEWPPPVAGAGKKGWREWGCTAIQIYDHTCAALDRMLENFGRKSLYYTYPYFWQALAYGLPAVKGGPPAMPGVGVKAMSEIEKMADLWVPGGAQYVNGNGKIPTTDQEAPAFKPPFRLDEEGKEADPVIWQHDGNGGRKFKGVDFDFCVFYGNEEDLAAYCSTHAPDAVLPFPHKEEQIVPDHLQVRDFLLESNLAEYRRQQVEKWMKA